MTIEFNKTFGAGSATAPKSGDQPKAQLWVNLGYVAEGANEDGSDRFVSLPVGIPLDTMEPVSTRSSNADYSAFQTARNDLLSQIMEAGAALPPGGEATLALTVQLRRVSGDPAPIANADNKFARKIDIVVPAE